MGSPSPSVLFHFKGNGRRWYKGILKSQTLLKDEEGSMNLWKKQGIAWLWKGHVRSLWYQVKDRLHPRRAEEVMGTASMERARSALDCMICP